MRARLHLLVIASISICCPAAHAGWYCLSVEKLKPPSVDVKEKIEAYLLERYHVDHMHIGRLEGDFYLAWPSTDTHLEFKPPNVLSDPVVCRSCFYHLIRQREPEVTELLTFVGGGVVLFSDFPGGPNRILKDNYLDYYLKQENKSYLHVGIPQKQGAPFVQAPSSDAHLPPCEGIAIIR